MGVSIFIRQINLKIISQHTFPIFNKSSNFLQVFNLVLLRKAATTFWSRSRGCFSSNTSKNQLTFRKSWFPQFLIKFRIGFLWNRQDLYFFQTFLSFTKIKDRKSTCLVISKKFLIKMCSGGCYRNHIQLTHLCMLALSNSVTIKSGIIQCQRYHTSQFPSYEAFRFRELPHFVEINYSCHWLIIAGRRVCR